MRYTKTSMKVPKKESACCVRPASSTKLGTVQKITLISSSTSKLQFLTCDEWSIRPDTTELSLVSKHLGPADAQLMAGVIKFNSALVSLNLENNEFGDEGTAALAAVLPSR